MIGGAVGGDRRVLDALARDEAPTSAALFAPRVATGRDDVRDAIEPALARALGPAPSAPSTNSRAGCSCCRSGRDVRRRSVPSRRRFVLHLRRRGRDWLTTTPGPGCLSPAARGVDLIRDRRTRANRRRPHQPGCGFPKTGRSDRGRSALSPVSGTGRLPYSMLAEELVLGARRTM